MPIELLSPRAHAREIADALENLYAELFGPQAVLPAEVAQAALEDWHRNGRAHWAFRATDEVGDMVAFFTLAESFAFFAHGAYGILNELWVRPDARSRGVGREILQFCGDFARQRGWERIDVSAPPLAKWDRTVSFYEKNGFVVTGRKLKLLLDPTNG